MAYTPLSNTTAQLQIPGGVIEFARLDANEVPGGFKDFGIVNEFTASIESEVLQKSAARSGTVELVDQATIRVTRTASLSIAQFSLENLALWFSATREIQAQTSGSVTNEDIVISDLDASYQIGRTASNPSGVRSITSPTFAIKEGETASAWASETAKTLGAFVKEVSTPTHYYECTTAGTTGAVEPTWITTLGGTTTDGTVVWTCRGLITPELTTDYTIDSTLARVFIPLTSRIIVGHTLRVDYTKSAVERELLKTGAEATTTCAIKIISNPVRGTPRDYYFPKCTISPTGDHTFYAEEPAYNAMTFNVAILKPSDGPSGEDISAIYIDGRPVA